jgi:hypothetical protein
MNLAAVSVIGCNLGLGLNTKADFVSDPRCKKSTSQNDPEEHA